MQYRPHFLQLLHLYPQQTGCPKVPLIFQEVPSLCLSFVVLLVPYVLELVQSGLPTEQKSCIILMIRFQSLDLTYIFKNSQMQVQLKLLHYLSIYNIRFSFQFEFEFFAQLTQNKNATQLHFLGASEELAGQEGTERCKFLNICKNVASFCTSVILLTSLFDRNMQFYYSFYFMTMSSDKFKV